MSYILIPSKELKVRVNKLQQQLLKTELDGVMLTKNVEIFYFSGSMQNSMMYIPKNGDPILFVKKSIERAQSESPFTVEGMNSLKKLPEQIKNRGYKFEKVGIELDVIPYNNFMRIQKAFSETVFSDISHTIKLIRSVKSEYEIDQIRQSAKVVNEVIQEIPNILSPGITELNFSAEIEKIIRVRGHIGYIRTRAYNMELVLGMVASGSAASSSTSFDGPAGGEGITPAMPQGSGWKKIEKNEPILIDIATAVNGYMIDQTRLAVIGELDEELERAYQLSLHIIKETVKNAKPGTLWSEHYYKALKMAEEGGFKDHFMGYKKDQARFLGHGVGLELDELPVLAKGLDYPLETGMVIAIEPKFTFPGKGVIGIENTYVVTDSGLESLSISPEEIIRIPILS